MAAALAARRSFHFSHPTKGANPMYTRVVELTSKSGKARELCDTIDEKVVPILKKQTGFVDETVLASDVEPNRVLGLSFWNSKEDAERYHREQYPQIHETMKHLLETDPVIRTFDVQSSTTHRITARKAA
jgi:heme-degrading monooxygenase HmoA